MSKHINRPTLRSAKELSPLELNDVKFSNRRTVITAADLAVMGAQTPDKGAVG